MVRLPPDELPFFAERYSAATGGLHVDLAHLRGDGVRGLFLDGALVAGYRVAAEAVRYPQVVGPRAVASWPFSPNEAAETSHLWMAPDLRVEHRRALYGWVLADLLATGQPYFVGGALQPAVIKQQRRSLPFLLDEFESDALGRPVKGAIYYGTMATIVADAVQTGIPLPWLAIGPSVRLADA